MNTKHHLNHLKLALIVGALTLPLITQAGHEQKKERARYKLIDLGTLGGPGSGFNGPSKILNHRGTAVGGADTPNPDPFNPNCFSPGCFIQHAFRWQKGVLTDLGALPGGGSSTANAINESGQTVGESQNGLIDPLTGTPEQIAVLWEKNGEITTLGTLGGNQSFAVALNNRGQAVGWTANAIADIFSPGAETRAFLWENGVMRDLGTLGGPASMAAHVNERGQVAGLSYTDSTPNDTTGIPTIHSFLWEHGKMLDLGSFGGTLSFPDRLNNRGQVVGVMTLPGDEAGHPFIWDRGTLTDLGTFGGSNGEAFGINDAGEVVGHADFPGDVLHNAFLWKNGAMTDLGNLGITSSAEFINSKGQVVGASRVSRVPSQASAFLWENGGPMVDLNTLIPADSALHLVFAKYINDRGEIAGNAVPLGVSLDDFLQDESLGHAFLLIPLGKE